MRFRRFQNLMAMMAVIAILLIMGCGTGSSATQDRHGPVSEAPNTMVPSIFVDGEVYSVTSIVRPIEPDTSEIKHVTSVVSSSQIPKQEGEINFPLENGVYVHINEEKDIVAVLMDQKWRMFEKYTQGLSTGKYIMENARVFGGTWVFLRNDMTFAFMRDIATSYVPQGTYSLHGEVLKLTVSEKEEYTFLIDGQRLVLQTGTAIKDLVDIGSVFTLNHVEKIVDSTLMRFSESEILEGVSLVEENFSFPGATLKEVSYIEERSANLTESYMRYGKGKINGVKRENVLVLLSEFVTDNSTSQPVLNPNSTYSDYQWILIRDSEQGPWRIDDQGY